MRYSLLGSPLLLVWMGCAAARGSEPQASDPWRIAVSQNQEFAARWRPTQGSIPVNGPFEIDLSLTSPTTGEPIDGEPEVYVHAWMPDHRHGMLRQPQATRTGDGAYRVRGMLLHMGGFWQVFVDVVRDGQLERAEFEVHL